LKAAEYLQIPPRGWRREKLTVFCAALIGAGLGFLWFNCHPAQVFHGRYRVAGAGRGRWASSRCWIHQPLVLVIAGGGFS